MLANIMTPLFRSLEAGSHYMSKTGLECGTCYIDQSGLELVSLLHVMIGPPATNNLQCRIVKRIVLHSFNPITREAEAGRSL